MPIGDLPPTGTPTYPWILFRGSVIGKKMERQGELLRVTLDLEDYNRLFALTKVGAPDGANFLHQPDPPPLGTDVAIDPSAQTAGGVSTDAVYVLHFGFYFPVYGLTIDDTTWVDTVSGPPDSTLPDFSIALSDFKTFSDTLVAYMGPYARAWLSPDIALNITRLAAVGDISDVARAAPWAINDDDASGANTAKPIDLFGAPDYVRNRWRIFVRGGSPASSLWVNNPGINVRSGEDYYDAPGAVTADDAATVAEWALSALFATTLQGTFRVPVGFDGWRVGQTVFITCLRLGDADYSYDEMPAPIQRVAGRLVGPGAGLTFTKNTVAFENVTWKMLEFAESLSGPEKATVVVEIVDPDETFEVAKFDEILITTDGNADIEYDIAYGDIEAGDLTKALARTPIPPPQRPVYHFIVTVNDPILPLLSGVAVPESLVVAQLADSSDKSVPEPGVIMTWVLLQWQDDDMTVPASSLGLDDAAGTTDATGRVYTRITTTGAPDAVAYEIQALALPIP